MLVINNLETQNDYAAELTVDSRMGPPGGRLVYVVANHSARAQFRPAFERGGSEAGAFDQYPEILLTPQSSFIDKIGGARFRSAVAGSPARIVAQLSEPGDILPASGTPFTATLAASGEAVAAVLDAQGAGASANLTLTVATQVIPGTLLNFTIVGAAAKIVVVGSFDFVISVAGTGILAGSLLLDGGGLGGEALYGEGTLNVRGNAAQTWAQSVGAGAHTVELAARKSAAAGTAQAIAGNTRISLIIIDR